MKTVRLACHAMASRFELVLQGEDEVWLRAAGEEALAEVARLEAQLSMYRASSEVSRLNARAAEGPVRVAPRLFRLLQTAQRLHAATDGAFDVTVGPLMRCWGFVRGTGHLPAPAALAEARSRTGMPLVRLDEASFTVSFARPGVALDLGAIGKGYAVDEAMRILRETGVTRAFLHGGTSTIAALGRPYDADSWKVTVELPDPEEAAAAHDRIVAVVPLEDEALSVSAVWGKAFTADGRTYGHVLDPRLGRPVEGAVLAAVALPSATEADALSTAALVLGHESSGVLHRWGGRLRAAVALPAGGAEGYRVIQQDMPALASQVLGPERPAASSQQQSLSS